MKCLQDCEAAVVQYMKTPLPSLATMSAGFANTTLVCPSMKEMLNLHMVLVENLNVTLFLHTSPQTLNSVPDHVLNSNITSFYLPNTL